MPNLQDQLSQIVTTLIRMGQIPPVAFVPVTVSAGDAPGLLPLAGGTVTGTVTLPGPVLSGTVTGTYTLGGTPTVSAPILSGTITGTYTLAGTPTITAPAISAPVLSGTATGTYTLGGTPTISSPTITAPTISGASSIRSSSASLGIGYSTGAGGAVTQGVGRTTGVTVNAISGTITTDTASLAAEAAAAFVVTNSSVAIGDVVLVSQRSGAVGAMTDVVVVAVAAGSFTISVMNNNPAAGVAETGAIIINFCVIKAVSA